jgi:hypothetical protein
LWQLAWQERSLRTLLSHRFAYELYIYSTAELKFVKHFTYWMAGLLPGNSH